MPGQLVLEGGKAHIVGSDEGSRKRIFDEHVTPLKFVTNVFFEIDGSAEVWCEIVLGNEHPEEPIRIDEVSIGFNNIGGTSEDVKNLGPAKSSITELGDDVAPLLLESTGSQDEKWYQMYDDLNMLDDENSLFGFHQNKNLSSNDKIFDYRMGPVGSHHHVYSTPVIVDSEKDTTEDPNTNHPYILKNIRKLSDRNDLSGRSPILISKNRLDSEIEDDSRFRIRDDVPEKIEQVPQRIDTISIWIQWKEIDLCTPKDDISYHFRYTVDCDVEQQAFDYSYLHYILPKESVLMGRSLLMESLSENRVEEFHPAETRWMFKEWENRYDVEHMSSARMTRSIARGDPHVFNSGRIGFPALRARNTALQFVLIILSGWAIQNAFAKFSGNSIVNNPSIFWPLILPILSFYIILKGYGPPPYFPKWFKPMIVPLEREILERIFWFFEWVIGLPGGIRSWLESRRGML